MSFVSDIKQPVKRGLYQFERFLGNHFYRNARARIGWVTHQTLSTPSPYSNTERLGHLGSVADMRISNNAKWMNEHGKALHNEIYDPNDKYDMVIFVKAMDQICQIEARRIQSYGGKIVFDANVNYYKIWGDYDIPSTKPTPQQQKDAIRMTQLADWVVADSTYLQSIISEFNPNVTWIPDNVNLSIFHGQRQHLDKTPITLVWSGVAQKAHHLLEIKDALRATNNIELVLVSNAPPSILAELAEVVPCRYIAYTNKKYAQTLLESDIIISPRRLNNGYVMGHTEYKITLGMALGLPAIASPQQSYKEAINHLGGGFIAEHAKMWVDSLTHLTTQTQVRAEMGAKARQTVREHYSTPVVAQRYLDLIENLL